MGKRGPSNVMYCGFVKELFLSSSPCVVRVVSSGRSGDYSGEGKGLRMMRVLLSPIL